MSFSTDFEPNLEILPGHWVIAVVNQRLLVRKQDQRVIFPMHELGDLTVKPDSSLHLGLWRGNSCFVLEFKKDSDGFDNDYEVLGLRSLLSVFDHELFGVVARALQLLHWQNSHRFCGCCGAPTALVTEERALQCGLCNRLFYPQISPCVIGIVIHERRCLLARNARFTEGLFSTIAGFIEPGESAEAALRREIKEEVGVEVGDLEYVTSQPWPFPSQLMLGFIAHYDSGEIRVDGTEIVEAKWFDIEHLPQVPPAQTISGLLIRTFLNRVRNV